MAAIVFINGSFGVGKTTTANLLRSQLVGAVIYDPEVVGSCRQRLPRWIPVGRERTDDFQDLQSWRTLTVAGIVSFSRLARGPVIVPMTLSQPVYFNEIVHGVQRWCSPVLVYCLTAKLATIRERLAQRGTPTNGPSSEWIARRTGECVAAFARGGFGNPVDTEYSDAEEVAAQIAAQLVETDRNRAACPPRQ